MNSIIKFIHTINQLFFITKDYLLISEHIRYKCKILRQDNITLFRTTTTQKNKDIINIRLIISMFSYTKWLHFFCIISERIWFII